MVKEMKKTGRFRMLTEKEVVIIETLVEEEMGYLKSASDDIAARYLRTLSTIVEKLKKSAENSRVFSGSNMPISVR